MSGVDPDPLINLALAIAQRRCAEHPEIAAAYATYDADLANAWKEDPEFEAKVGHGFARWADGERVGDLQK